MPAEGAADPESSVSQPTGGTGSAADGCPPSSPAPEANPAGNHHRQAGDGDAARSLLVRAGAELLADIARRASTSAPSDPDLKEGYPGVFWALNQRADSEGKPVLGGTVTVQSDGGGYVVYLTLRQIAVTTAFRVEELLNLWDVLERVLSDPGTSWRVWTPAPKKK